MTLAQYEDMLDYYDTPKAKAGYAAGFFIYSNKAVQIKGTEEDGDTLSSYSYNINLNKGWNELVFTCTSATDQKISISVTANNEPSGMKWIYGADTDLQYVRKKALKYHDFHLTDVVLKK
jgi:hypothetical protein